MARRRVAVVPHTHWDREWHASFQATRVRLAEVLDTVVDGLETPFLLDGQMAMVDDYLEVRPDAGPRLRELVVEGAIEIGPWYVLMDEFLVSGETIVRNLELGMRRARDLGAVMCVGYLPDMFGHVAQMPQLLRHAGIEHAVVWRGVPGAVDRTAFWWSAPDGSTVRTEYLPVGYANGAYLPSDPDRLLARVRTHEEELRSFWLDAILLMNGTDHASPQPGLAAALEEANATQDEYRFELSTLTDYLAGACTADLPSWTGELRSGARANLVMGVISNRVDLKQAAAATERVLERLAEPLAALFLPASRWPGPLLDIAWREVVRNAAHDSIAGCVPDAIADAVRHRYHEASDIGTAVVALAVDAVATSMAEPGPVIVNPSARARSGVVEIVTDGGDASVHEERITWEELPRILGAIRGQTYDGMAVRSLERDGATVVVRLAAHAPPDPGIEETKRQLWAEIASRRDKALAVRIERASVTRSVVRVEGVPGYGWKSWRGVEPETAPVEVHGAAVRNGLVSVVVDRETGTFSLDGVGGLDRLIDERDDGDMYNAAPADVIAGRPVEVSVGVAESGPARGVLQVTRTFRWPEETVVETRLELHAGERFIRVSTTFENRSSDHRLRAHFPLPKRTTSSEAECAFAIVRRPLTAEGSDTERGLPTFPSRRFVRAGGLTVVHDGLLEYEVVDDGHALAVTLLRSVGVLSRDVHAYRSVPAGPALDAPGAQLHGRREARYAVAVGDIDPYAMAEDAFVPLLVAYAPGGGGRPLEGQALAVEGDAEVSAVRRVDGALQVRLFNPRAGAARATVGGKEVELPPCGIVTVTLDD